MVTPMLPHTSLPTDSTEPSVQNPSQNGYSSDGLTLVAPTSTDKTQPVPDASQSGETDAQAVGAVLKPLLRLWKNQRVRRLKNQQETAELVAFFEALGNEMRAEKCHMCGIAHPGKTCPFAIVKVAK